jgi:NAD(P)-dependent dehydrogenase (short-subunit alcohol dehydrogenase family)
MAQRAAIVTGGSSGIGLGIARVLGEEGYAVTVAARRPEKLEEAVEGLRADGYHVNSVSGNLADEAVDTPMTDFVKEQISAEDMIQVSDVAETVRVLLKMSPGCIVPEVQFLRPGDRL